MSVNHSPHSTSLLNVSGLRVTLKRNRSLIRPVDNVDFTIAAGQTFALLGESGCGKSMTALALNRLLPDAGQIEGGTVHLHQQDLFDLSEARMREIRGKQIGMIFQEPSSSLNPVMTVFEQIAEVLYLHRGLKGKTAREETQRLLESVGIPDAQHRLNDYPFQFSGGMKQRVMIAIALAAQPALLIADEPTTALDVTTQAQVLDLLSNLQAETGMGILLITHDLGVVARMAHHVGVMYAGHLVERSPSAAFFQTPLHPYSRKLFAALPSRAYRGQALDAPQGNVPPLDHVFPGCRFADRCPLAFDRCDDEAPAWHTVNDQAVRCHLYEDISLPRPLEKPAITTPPIATLQRPAQPLLDIRNLSVHFPVRKGLFKRQIGQIHAVDTLSLQLVPGRTLALVGESGCGKTTVGKAILQLISPSRGEIFFDGNSMIGAPTAQLKAMRRGIQMVFQDPFASLNPRMRISEIIEEGMISLETETDTASRHRKIDELLARIGLSSDMRWRYPHEFSGGQRQRIAIARALAVTPQAIIFDEPTSALDVSVQAQLLNLIRELQREHQLAYLFITHNLAVVEYIADDIAVMYLGRIIEQGPAAHLLNAPAHPYTQTLLNAVLQADSGSQPYTAHKTTPQQVISASSTPSPLSPPPGCHFHPRCPHATDICRTAYPGETMLTAGHTIHCHWPQSVLSTIPAPLS